MNTPTTLRTALAIAALLALPLAQAADMSKGDYDTAKSRIASVYKADKAACDSRAGNAKDVCVEEAKGKEKIALAELEYGYSGKPADQTKLQEVRAESNYAVAKEKCDDLAGNPKDVCVQQAQAAKSKAMADAKAGKQIGEARDHAEADKRAADYKVAAEKCDALAGDAKRDCIAAAKARFGKS